MKDILDIIQNNKKGLKKGIYAVCCAQPLVIEAAILQASKDNSLLLIEATANQVNQFGGYTGMCPKAFISFVADIAQKTNFPMDNIILGGDHLGPVCWVDEKSEFAMEKAKKLVESYVVAGFSKIHLDCSMPCADDLSALTDQIIAERAATLCEVAEQTAMKEFGAAKLVYVIGTEVPSPGGSTEEIDELELTTVENVQQTLDTHLTAFKAKGLQAAWQRVIGLVVQPGVEFDHTSVINYQSDKAQALSRFIAKTPNIVFEAHSTDYQLPSAYQELVNDHFAILKVGPQLTFAMREAIFSLSHIEDELINIENRSNLKSIFEREMLEQDKHWCKFYQVPASKGLLYRRYSYSDRLRYYWNLDIIEAAVNQLFNNLDNIDIPLPLISQYLPEQYQAIRQGRLTTKASALVIDKIMQVTEIYSYACNKQIG
ncbi:MAG: D-tagatose-bisphosphate aldolase, class II, non-catalytic subunit [Colwellia sp.]